MSKTLANFYSEQFSRLEHDLQSNWGVDPAALKELSADLKGIHRKCLSLACIATVAGARAKRSEYIKEVVDTTYLAVVLAVKGLKNASNVLLRQSIELVLKHVYFMTHPVEYAWAASRDAYKDLTFQSLLSYMGRTEEYGALGQGNAIRDKLDQLFGELSRYVHVHSRKFLGYRKVGMRRGQGKLDLKGLRRMSVQLWPTLILIVVSFSSQRYLRAAASEKRLIRNGLTAAYRRILDSRVLGQSTL